MDSELSFVHPALHETMAGIAGQKFISLPAYEAMWEHVLELTPEYDPKILRRYAPASKEVYGEVNPVLVSDFIKALKLSSQDVLYDLGSGVGNVQPPFPVRPFIARLDKVGARLCRSCCR